MKITWLEYKVYRTNFNSQYLYLNDDVDVEIPIQDIKMALKSKTAKKNNNKKQTSTEKLQSKQKI